MSYKRDMKLHEEELMAETSAHFFFMEKTGWTNKEVSFALLMKIDFDTILDFVQKMENIK